MDDRVLPLDHERNVLGLSPEFRSREPGIMRERLRSLLGLGRMFPSGDDSVAVEYVRPGDGFEEIRFRFESEAGFTVPAHLLIPDGAGKPPVMICLQGHSTGMHLSMGRPLPGQDPNDFSGDRDFAIGALEQGYCALCMEQRCFGEQGGTPYPDCGHTAYLALINGRTLVGERVFDVGRAIDILRANFADRADTDRIFIMGNSGGGTATIYSCAADERLSGGICSCAFSTFAASIGASRHCPCNYIPGVARDFDMADIGGLVSPRPLVIVAGRDDEIFPAEQAGEQFELMRELYYGQDGKCRLVVGSGGHRFYKEQGWQAFNELVSR